MHRLRILPLVLALGCGPAAAPPVELGRLGLKMDVPLGFTVGDGIAGGALVEGHDLLITVDPATEAHPRTAEEAALEVDMFNPEQAKSEVLADGFGFTFETPGDVGRNFFVHVRREIGGKSYWCEATVTGASAQATALAACKSLRR
jgi:hypothetical protein